MLITEKEILFRFLKHLSWATEIDIATAWATSNEALRALQQQGSSPKVRAVVGLWGNQTDPIALKILNNIGRLHGADATRNFHPKVFIFRDNERSVAWVGSANFTSGGFGRNEEALFETHDTQSVQDWFDHLWEHCDPLDDDAIDTYAESRTDNPPPPSPRRRPQYTGSSPLQLLKEVGDWPSYVEALSRCDGWWDSNHHSFSVLGERCSWLNTIEALHDVICQPDWGELNRYNRRRLLGLIRGEGWALLGRMRGPALDTVFGTNRKTIQDIVLAAADADDNAFPQLAFESCAALEEIHGVGLAIATRLLTLARPDRFVSFNKKSIDGFADFCDLDRSITSKNYTRILEFIYDMDWYKTPKPKTTLEHTISRLRMGLLDCFVYKV